MTERGDNSEPTGSDGGNAQISLPTAQLVEAFLEDYEYLLRRLRARFGSDDVAIDALQEVYLKLMSSPNIGEVRSSRAYLFRMAINIVLNLSRRPGRFIADADSVFENLADRQPGQDRVVFAADEMKRAIELLHALPQRVREIFLAKWRDDKTLAEIATEFGLHERSVQKDLSKARRHLERNLRRLR